MLIVDAHLDLSYNALKGRDVLLPAGAQIVAKEDEGGIPTVGLPDLRAGGVALVCATIFCIPATPDPDRPGQFRPGYRTAEEASAVAWRQFDWYRRQRDAGQFRFVTRSGDVQPLLGRAVKEGREANRTSDDTIAIANDSMTAGSAAATGSPSPAGGRSVAPVAGLTLPPRVAGERAGEEVGEAVAPLPMILLMEGADPIRSPEEVAAWYEAGLRIVGLAWKQTRLAGGTGAPGALTTEGVRLVRELDQFGIIHDASHLAEEAFWHLLEISGGPVIASHSNCRSIVPTDRQLSDVMIRAICQRGGVVGINFFDRFLLPPDDQGQRRATLRDLVHHVQHVCDLAGDARHVGLGTDMDGGLGRNEIPVEVATSADLPAVGDALAAAGFPDADVRAVLGENWLRYFARHLPADAPGGAARGGG